MSGMRREGVSIATINREKKRSSATSRTFVVVAGLDVALAESTKARDPVLP
jgi:hypothetical protein